MAAASGSHGRWRFRSLERNEDNWIRGAKWGANRDRFRATSGHDMHSVGERLAAADHILIHGPTLRGLNSRSQQESLTRITASSGKPRTPHITVDAPVRFSVSVCRCRSRATSRALAPATTRAAAWPLNCRRCSGCRRAGQAMQPEAAPARPAGVHALAWCRAVCGPDPGGGPARMRSARSVPMLAAALGIAAAAAAGCSGTGQTAPAHLDSRHSPAGRSCPALPGRAAITLTDTSPQPVVTVPPGPRIVVTVPR